jgi:hypothetical protein
MVARYKRNEGLHTSVADAKTNILLHLHRYGVFDWRRGLRKAELGFAAYPDYDFARPQGAAFAVAKLVREMEDDDLIGWYVDERRHGGYYLKPAGVASAAARAAVVNIAADSLPMQADTVSGATAATATQAVA